MSLFFPAGPPHQSFLRVLPSGRRNPALIKSTYFKLKGARGGPPSAPAFPGGSLFSPLDRASCPPLPDAGPFPVAPAALELALGGAEGAGRRPSGSSSQSPGKDLGRRVWYRQVPASLGRRAASKPRSPERRGPPRRPGDRGGRGALRRVAVGRRRQPETPSPTTQAI